MVVTNDVNNKIITYMTIPREQDFYNNYYKIAISLIIIHDDFQ